MYELPIGAELQRGTSAQFYLKISGITAVIFAD